MKCYKNVIIANSKLQKWANWVITATVQIFANTNFRGFAKKNVPKCAKISTTFTRENCLIMNNNFSTSKFVAHEKIINVGLS